MTEADRRKAIWLNLAEFYLDTELQETDYLRIAEVFKKSNFTLEEIKEIDLYEVFPTLQSNLNSVAGEWAGFPEDWLIQACTNNLKRRSNKLFRLLTSLRYKNAYWMRKTHWERLEALWVPV